MGLNMTSQANALQRENDTFAASDIALALEQLMRLHFSQSFKGGLKPAQWHALRYFAHAPKEERTVTAFARHRASTMGTASTTISTLVRKGLLARDYGNGVPRNRGLHVTEAGLELLTDDPIQALVDTIGALEQTDTDLLRSTLPKLVDRMAHARNEEAAA